MTDDIHDKLKIIHATCDIEINRLAKKAELAERRCDILAKALKKIGEAEAWDDTGNWARDALKAAGMGEPS